MSLPPGINDVTVLRGKVSIGIRYAEIWLSPMEAREFAATLVEAATEADAAPLRVVEP